MLDLALDLLRWWRPSRYRGVGIRGGVVLGILWAIVSAAATQLEWKPFGLALALIVSAVVGYRLEWVGGAIAVAIFSLGFWWLALSSGWPWPGTSGFGFIMGLVYGAATTETPKSPKGRRSATSAARPRQRNLGGSASEGSGES